MTREVEGKTVAEMIILHLLYYRCFEKAMVCPRGMTQEGIAEKLGKSRQHISVELKKLRDKCHVAFNTAHSPKAKTRRKAFYLTPEGIRLATQIREMRRAEVADSLIDEARTGRGGDRNPPIPADASA